MSFFTDHLERIIHTYEGTPPLSIYLKQYFRAYPKLGSRDRRALSEAVFIFYRCKRFFPEHNSIIGIVIIGYALCNSSNVFLWRMLEPYTINQQTVAPDCTIDITVRLSSELPVRDWFRSMWQQPKLFLRLRKQQQRVITLLQEHNIAFEMENVSGDDSKNCLSLKNGAAVDKVLPAEDYVVQDLSSQQSVYTLLQYLPASLQSVWDVCSGAGGKSILLKDKLSSFRLLASDIRESILHNLKARFSLYNLSGVKTMIVNSADPVSVQTKIGEQRFDLVLCDVPCSGSGTWSRTPEQFHFFKEEQLQQFEAVQYLIAFNASKHISLGGILAYITCSVFEKENEQVVHRLLQDTGLTLLHQQIINGIDNLADCMFIAVFRKEVIS